MEKPFDSLNTLFLALHLAVEECVAGRIKLSDLEDTRNEVFIEYLEVPWNDEKTGGVPAET